MSRGKSGAALVLVLVLASALPKLAVAQAPDTSRDDEAHSLFEAGRTAFAAGRYEDALGYFQHAYDLSQRPGLLYNIGQCEDRRRHDAAALDAFERFLAAVPDSPTRVEVEARMTFLRAAIASSRPAPPPDPVAASTPARQTETIVPWILVGVAAAVAIAGAIMVGVGTSDIASVEHATPGTSYSAVRDVDQQAPILTGVGWTAIGVGVAGIAASVAWGVIGSGHRDQVALRVGPTGLSITGTF